MATHSSILAWRIPGTEKPGGLLSMESQSNKYKRGTPVKEYNTFSSLVAQMVKNPPSMPETQIQSWVGKIPWRRKWQPTPVFFSLENPMDRRPWWVTVHGVTKNQTQLSN